MCRRQALGLALTVAAMALTVFGGRARAERLGVERAGLERLDRSTACEGIEFELEFERGAELLSMADLGARSLWIEASLGDGLLVADCSLFDGGACEEAGLSISAPLAPSFPARCEGPYGLSFLRIRAPRLARLGAPWPDPMPVARLGLGAFAASGSLAPASVEPRPPSPPPAPVIVSALHGLRPRGAIRLGKDVATSPPLAAGFPRALERPPRS